MQFDPTIITETDLLTLHDQRTLAEEIVVPGITPDTFSTYTIPSSKVVLLRENPKQEQLTIPTGTTVTQVPGGPFIEVFGTPAAGQFVVNYTNATVTFNSVDVGKNVLISYTATGSVVHAAHVNNISKPFVPFYNKLNGIVPDGGVDFTFPNDVTVTGNLNIIGIVNREGTEVINIRDQIIFLNQNVVADTGNVGLEVSIGNAAQGSITNPQFLWNEASSTWLINSTSSGPYAPSTGAVFKVYNKGGVQVTRLTTTQETALVGTLGVNDGGLQWFNTTTSQFMGWNGTITVILG